MRTVGALVFPGFQTLDFFGPIEVLGGHNDREIQIRIVAETLDPVPSRHGVNVNPEVTLAESPDFDLILLPGGDATPLSPVNPAVNEWIIQQSQQAELVLAVCTGTVLLATTGLLDGRRATTNKIDFNDTIGFGPKVEWIKKARWVEDGKFFTSSGVSAGMDMAFAAMARLFGEEVADEVAIGIEYDRHRDADWDPFSMLAGL